jgi:hypothetical protein
MSLPSEQEILAREEQIRITRLTMLLGSWQLVSNKYTDLPEGARLNKVLAAAVVERYLADRQAVMARHVITGRIQRHKIAGLMAASIVKVRPIQLLDDMGTAARVSKDNEILAVWHGLAICAEGDKTEGAQRLVDQPKFGHWLSDFVYLLSRRQDCAEQCSFIFETLSLTYFPDNFDRRK